MCLSPIKEVFVLKIVAILNRCRCIRWRGKRYFHTHTAVCTHDSFAKGFSCPCVANYGTSGATNEF